MALERALIPDVTMLQFIKGKYYKNVNNCQFEHEKDNDSNGNNRICDDHRT